MAAESLWRTWRREVHDILEVGGDAYPIGRVVNGFIIVLIILNAVAFAAETVDLSPLATQPSSISSTFSRWRCSASNTCCASGARSISRC
jgi:hypothetical protein